MKYLCLFLAVAITAVLSYYVANASAANFNIMGLGFK